MLIEDHINLQGGSSLHLKRSEFGEAITYEANIYIIPMRNSLERIARKRKYNASVKEFYASVGRPATGNQGWIPKC